MREKGREPMKAGRPPAARVADLGAGCGTLGVLLCKNAPDCAVTGVELDAAAHALALENIRENGLEGRLTALHGDVRQIRALLPAAEFDCVVSNPPYFPVGSGRRSARRRHGCCGGADGFSSSIAPSAFATCSARCAQAASSRNGCASCAVHPEKPAWCCSSRGAAADLG